MGTGYPSIFYSKYKTYHHFSKNDKVKYYKRIFLENLINTIKKVGKLWQ